MPPTTPPDTTAIDNANTWLANDLAAILGSYNAAVRSHRAGIAVGNNAERLAEYLRLLSQRAMEGALHAQYAAAWQAGAEYIQATA